MPLNLFFFAPRPCALITISLALTELPPQSLQSEQVTFLPASSDAGQTISVGSTGSCGALTLNVLYPSLFASRYWTTVSTDAIDISIIAGSNLPSLSCLCDRDWETD